MGAIRGMYSETLLRAAAIAGGSALVADSTTTVTIYERDRVTLANHYSARTGGSPSTAALSPDALGRVTCYLEQGWYYVTTSGGIASEVFIDAPAYYAAEEFGAVGDGSTDDAAAIRSAITQANTDGVPEVRLGNRTYAVSSAVTPLTGVTVSGSLLGGTTLQVVGTWSGASGGGVVAFASTVSKAGVRDITIDVNNKTGGIHGVSVTGASDIAIERLRVTNYGQYDGGTNSYRGMSIHGNGASTPATNITIRDCTLDTPSAANGCAAGIAIGSSGNGAAGVRNLLVENVVIDHSAVAIGATDLALFGVEIALTPTDFTSLSRSSQQIMLRNVRVKQAYTRSFSVAGGAADVTLIGCVSEGVRNNGVTARTNVGFHLTNYPTQGSGNWAAGSQPTYNSNVRFIGCTAVGQLDGTGAYTATHAGSGFGMVSDASRVGVAFVGCTADHMQHYGFNLHGTANLSVTDCKATDCGIDGFRVTAGGSEPSPVHFVGCVGSRNAAYGLEIDAAAVANVRWFGGRLANNTTAAVRDLGTGTRVLDCPDYVTEAWGAQASVTDGSTINHGLAATPSLAVAQATVASQFAAVTAVSSTTITVALKTDAGVAGSSQTVRWYARV